MTDEEPALASYRSRSNVILHQDIVDLEASILEISPQSLVLVKEVVAGLAQGTLP